MSETDSLASEVIRPIFRPFTRTSLDKIHARMTEETNRKKELERKRVEGEGMPLPIRMAAAFETDLAFVPLEDIDPYYQNQPTFVIITKKKDIFRFSATKAVWLLDPFNPVRYVTLGISLGNLAALRTFRVLRALKTVAIIPGLKTIVGAVIESVKNLRDVIILTMFSLSVFALMGLQLYMGILTQKCILNMPDDIFYGDDEDIYASWYGWHNNKSNWYTEDPEKDYPLCGNSTGAGTCPGNYTCMQGFGKNPDYDYTSYDSFGWAFLSAFRLMTQDYWESLYQQTLRAAGPWHITFFLVIIFLGSYYLVNLILAIVAMSYDELQKKVEEEQAAQDAEEEAMRAEEEAREDAREVRDQARAARTAERDQVGENPPKSPVLSQFSSRSYEMWAGEQGADDQLKDAKSECGDSLMDGRLNGGVGTRVEKSTTSLPGSPYNVSRASHNYSQYSRCLDEKRPLILSTYLDAQQHLPFADDSTAATPMSEENGTIIVPFNQSWHPHHHPHAQHFGYISRHSSYNSHCSRLSYHSHDQLPVTKEKQLRDRSNKALADSSHLEAPGRFVDEMPKNKPTPHQQQRRDTMHSARYRPPSTSVDIRDVLVLADIIEQASGPPHSRRISDMEEEENARNLLKQKIIEGCFRCIDIFCVWNCGFPWSVFKKIVAFIVFDPFMELFITLAIVVNTVFMALDHYGLSDNQGLYDTLKTGNKVFTSIFTVECSMKLIAMSPKFYFQGGWNVFDFIIVFLSLLEMLFEDAGMPGISALRSFRLLRVFKLAKSWPTLNLLISIMGKTMGALGNLVFVLIIIIFIFAVMGMQLFARNYFDKVSLFPGAELPRWNFTDFGHSFMIIFRVLCGEWIESMWDCMLVTGPACIPFFLATVVIGNLVVLNLFLALLLSSFGASSLSAPTADADTNKLAEAFNRIGKFIRWIKKCVQNAIGCVYDWIMGLKNSIVNRIRNVIQPPPPPLDPADEASSKDVAPEPEIAEPVKAKSKLADTARLVIRTRKLMMTNLQQIKAAATSQQQQQRQQKEVEEKAKLKEEEEDNLSLKSYGSHTHYPIKGKPVKKKEPVVTISTDKDEVEYGFCDDDDDDDNKDEANDHDDDDDDDEDDWDDEDNEDEIMDEKPRRSIHSSQKQEEEEEEMPMDCFPPDFYHRFPILSLEGTQFGVVWANIRLKTFRLVENKYFETAVITMILLSSLALALEDVHLPANPILTDILFYMDRIFTVIFFFEMLIKFLALGFVSYFTNAWCWLDFVIVMVSVINFVAALLGFGSVQAFKTMRTLRALRPLRAMSRMQGMRIVVNALVQAIPSIFNVLLVCLIFWLIFAIMGVQLFSGKFHKCIDPLDGTRPDYRIIRDKKECLHNNMSWENSVMNFDHVGKAYLCLFQVATFKGWIQVMNDAIDSRDNPEHQPHREVNFVMYVYFVVFIIFGSFFTLNLFIGVIIDNFNEQKKKSGGTAMKKMGNKKPLKAIPRPSWRPQAIVFEIVMNKNFDMIIMLFIGLNMWSMTMDHYHQTESWDRALGILNAIFIAIFSAECGLKIFALRYHYFTEPWNLFDFVVVLLSVAGIMLSDIIAKYFVSPTLLRVVRVAKVGRVLRLVKGAKGIRTLLFALAMSLPALFNICLLLFLVMFIFAIFGMSFFMNVKLRDGLDTVYNFQTFGQSIILLFQMSTSAGWDSVLAGIINEDECDAPNVELGTAGTCGNSAVGIAYLLSYLVISFLIVINMYIAVILENYSQATEEVQEGLTDDDYDMYYEIWAQFDPDGTQYIRYDQLSDFLDVLEPPLQIHKPNRFKVISMDISICKGDMMYCVDILDALTRDFFARKGNFIQTDGADLAEVNPNLQDRPDYEPVSSTLWRQREEYCARLIQHAWRKHKNPPEDENATITEEVKGRVSPILEEIERSVSPSSSSQVVKA
ncbi:Sodium channel protein para [Folsomia candida]|uniref:Sodium channel protein n=1 Tax=Folsomia candida TaxID=158441 RepID=A0A226DXU1_FOLCA|nr:Sodium channel protein para [Folsomia candida]